MGGARCPDSAHSVLSVAAPTAIGRRARGEKAAVS
jgi:hypothetical protein